MTKGLTIESLRPIWPLLVLVVTAGLVLLGAIAGKDSSEPNLGPTGRRSLLAVALFGLAAAVVCALLLWPAVAASDRFSPGWFSDYLFFDPLYLFVTIFLCLFLAGVLVLSSSLGYGPAWEWPVFLALLFGSLVGLILLASARHLLFLAIALEMASLPSYVLVGFRRFNRKSAEGAAKYVIFGAVCSALMLYGISLLYGIAGSFDWPKIAQHFATAGLSPLAVAALVCLLIGLAFKISLVPVHFWCPDAFEAAGADVAAWLSVASKSAALLALARLLQVLGPSLAPAVRDHVLTALSTVAVVTMTLANLSAYWQTSVKRLLAYSSIAHAGYLTCGVLVLADTTGLAALVAYILVYLLMNLGAFTVAGLVERQTGSDHLDRFDGLGDRQPRLAAAMTIFLFSLVGLPPLAGFAAKWILLCALWRSHLTVLVVAILANTLFSLFYYLRITRAMYFSPLAPDESPPSDIDHAPTIDRPPPAVLAVPACTAVLLAACATGLVALFLAWGLLHSLSLNLFGLPT